ncbi:putative glycoside hydrolase [Actinoplanes siamensis]|uniref:Uncharacterized protein n=1 Tax=Actinoplanes siamensis TaxID=1223317 RepID=A0A919TN09_9ACTN|nr:putative glycoside hydrolase [Actinoplanes siamensis]GIF08242.1 hypothetical protein Asi03nite_57800 [Actinoplanes siamensis]
MTTGHWDSLPLFAHVDGAEYGDGLTDAQAEFLAHEHRIVVLGKWVGRTRHGSTEAGNAIALRRLKEINPDLRVHCFWAVNDQFSAFHAAAAVARVPQDYIVRHPDGGEYLSMPHHQDIFAWDTSHPELRKWWVTTIVDRVLEEGWDGVHVDGIKQYVMRRHVKAAALGHEVAAALAAGVDILLADLRAALPDRPILYNGIKSSPWWPDGGRRYLDAGLADGVLLESFGCGAAPSAEPAWMLADLDLVSALDRRNKVVVFGSKPDARPDPAEALRFSLACFLCSAGSNSYLRFPLPGLGRETFAPYLRPIGAPRGPAERLDGGLRLRRDFERVSVEVDLDTGAARFDWAAG